MTAPVGTNCLSSVIKIETPQKRTRIKIETPQKRTRIKSYRRDRYHTPKVVIRWSWSPLRDLNTFDKLALEEKSDTMHLFGTSNFIGPGYHAVLLFSGQGSICSVVCFLSQLV